MAEETTTTATESQTDETTTTTETTPPIVGQGNEGTTPVTAPADWPDDWRAKVAGGDDKKAQRLARYQSPQALADALFAAQNRIAAGDLKPALGKDAKPEEIAAYRESHGIPESAEKYDLAGLEIQAEEKAMIDKFLVSAHGANMTPAQVQSTIKSFQALSEEARNQRITEDNELRQKAEDALHAEWGNEYRGNINLLTNFLDTGPEGLRANLLHGRLADGTPIGSSPEALKFLVGLARERNPLGIVAPSGETVMGSNAISEYEEMRKQVGNPDFRRDPAKQERYQRLLSNLVERGLVDSVTGDVKRAA